MSANAHTKIAICGSMSAWDEMTQAAVNLSSQGVVCLLPKPEGVKVDFTATSDEDVATIKSTFIEAHLEKIRSADSILVINPPRNGIEGYIGANTLMEMAFAKALTKGIAVLFPPGQQPCRPEVLALKPRFLNGDLSLLMKRVHVSYA